MGESGFARWLWIIGFGFITWIVPFMASLALLSLEDYDQLLFRTVIILIGLAVTLICLVIYLPNSNLDYRYEGWLLGLVWLSLNLVLDTFLRYAINAANRENFDPLVHLAVYGWVFLYVPLATVASGFIAHRIEARGSLLPSGPPIFPRW